MASSVSVTGGIPGRFQRTSGILSSAGFRSSASSGITTTFHFLRLSGIQWTTLQSCFRRVKDGVAFAAFPSRESPESGLRAIAFRTM